MTEVFVGMGSNIEPAVHVPEALAALSAVFGELDVSPIYRCPAVGFNGHDFVNLVVAFESADDIGDVQRQLRRIEADCGRRQVVREGSRTMDLDMLLFGNTVFDNGDIRVPRADILDYAFVLRPLSDMRPQALHPVLARSYADLWAAFDAADQPLTEISLDQP
ncbi:MAG: 2-amino-4-hydroxy-6-hydroxymethyldihydropteridine diphosphokinase [Salinisphaera sp.]|jgi:2-amino-4-hydroxy-6-hydroxymethyldihydropteridine diphosphokinase|nr:2-amino-4-hydroxy-6-hydroxymethyldihydropteridine diphosphokinase [Salinisphaera sp.]